MTVHLAGILVALVVLLGAPAVAQQAAPKAGNVPANPPPKSGAASHAAPALAKQAGTQQAIAVPAPEVLLVLLRSALIALDHANRTGNYTVLRELGGPGLQQHSSAQLANVFASLRNQQVDLLPVAIVTPQLTQQPSVSPEGLLQLVGYFPTQPRPVQFHVVYQPVAGQWKLYGLTVGLAAPAAAPPAAKAPAEGKTDGAAPPPPAAKKK